MDNMFKYIFGFCLIWVICYILALVAAAISGVYTDIAIYGVATLLTVLILVNGTKDII